MKPCPTCKKMIAKAAQFCPDCGHKLYNSFGRFLKIVFLCIAGLVAFCIVVGSLMNNSTPAPVKAAASASASAPSKALPEADKAFVSASFSYLSGANTAGTQLATVWAGASDGTSTLSDCRAATNKALMEESKRYVAYRSSRGSIPPTFAHVDQNIVTIYTISVAALKGILSYWANQDLSAIQNGTDQYKEAVLMANSTVEEARKVMQSEVR